MITDRIDPYSIWPHDDRYESVCSKCKGRYYGPKRSGTCWKCTPGDTRMWWIMQCIEENERVPQ